MPSEDQIAKNFEEVFARKFPGVDIDALVEIQKETLLWLSSRPADMPNLERFVALRILIHLQDHGQLVVDSSNFKR